MFNEQVIPFEVFISNEDDFRPKFEEACDWLDALGLPHIATRFGHYKRFFDAFKNSEPLKQSADQYRKSIFQFLVAYSECAELVRIKSELSTFDANTYLGRLKKVVKGSPFAEMSGKDQSRDFAFELSVAARFIHGGYEVDLTRQADIVAIVDERKVFVECKRLGSASKLESNIRTARKQLATRFSAEISKKMSGLIALNIGPVIARDGPEVVGETEHDIQKSNSHLIDRFIADNQNRFNFLQNKYVGGYMVEASLGGIAANPKQFSLVNVRGMKIYMGQATSHTDEALIRQLASRISNQRI